MIGHCFRADFVFMVWGYRVVLPSHLLSSWHVHYQISHVILPSIYKLCNTGGGMKTLEWDQYYICTNTYMSVVIHVFAFCQLKVGVCNVFYMWKWACINPLDWSDNYVRMKVSKYRMVGNNGSSPLKSTSFSTVSVKMSESVWGWRVWKCYPHRINLEHVHGSVMWVNTSYQISITYRNTLMIVFASPKSQLTITTPLNCFSPSPNSWNTI